MEQGAASDGREATRLVRATPAGEGRREEGTGGEAQALAPGAQPFAASEADSGHVTVGLMVHMMTPMSKNRAGRGQGFHVGVPSPRLPLPPSSQVCSSGSNRPRDSRPRQSPAPTAWFSTSRSPAKLLWSPELGFPPHPWLLLRSSVKRPPSTVLRITTGDVVPPALVTARGEPKGCAHPFPSTRQGMASSIHKACLGERQKTYRSHRLQSARLIHPDTLTCRSGLA